MRKSVFYVSTLLLTSIQISFGVAAERTAERSEAIAQIEKLGGTVDVDEMIPGKPVVAVELRETKITDAGLICLEGLARLRTLDLGYTDVTDDGLRHIAGLTQIEDLRLDGTLVGGGNGLRYLRGMRGLRSFEP